MLAAENLSHWRGGRRLFHGLSFTLPPGCLLKISGKNGSGKSTLLKILGGIIAPHGGALYWQSKLLAANSDEADDYRDALLYLGHQNGLAEHLTAAENLRAAASLRRAPPRLSAAAARAALAAAGLPEQRLCRELSAGQKRRAALARLVAFPARLWLLDEPQAALDADGRALLAGWTRRHLAGGGSVICTMHHPHDWQPLAEPAAAEEKILNLSLEA